MGGLALRPLNVPQNSKSFQLEYANRPKHNLLHA